MPPNSLGNFQESFTFDANGNLKGIYPRLKREHAQFTRDWLLEIKDQQEL